MLDFSWSTQNTHSSPVCCDVIAIPEYFSCVMSKVNLKNCLNNV